MRQEEYFIKKFMLFLFLFISSLSFAEIRFKDDVDREIVLEKPLTRVVVLRVDITMSLLEQLEI